MLMLPIKKNVFVIVVSPFRNGHQNVTFQGQSGCSSKKMGGYWTGSFFSFFFLEVYAILQSDVRYLISILHSSLCIFSKFSSHNETTCHYKV